MLKYYCCLFIGSLLHTASYSQNKLVGYSSVITSITEQDTIKYLYQPNTGGNGLYVYQAGQGVSGTFYHLDGTSQGLILHSQPLKPGQQTSDSLTVSFDDAKFTVIITGRDYYKLFPAFYTELKNKIHGQHQIIDLLQLLSKAVGDYPIADMVPLFAFTSPAAMQVKTATITTQRSQAAVNDHWTVRYYYLHNRLDSVSAANREEVRFTNKIHYSSREISIRTYLNVEDRQITTTSMSYKAGDLTHRTMYKHTEETGKNQETVTVIHLTRRSLGILPDKQLTEAEIGNLIKR